MSTSFANWLREQLKERGWSQADLARHSKISSPHITRMMNDERNPGTDSAAAIAKALNVPVEVVYRKAGMLPPKKDSNTFRDQAEYLFNQLGESDQQEVIEYLKLKIRVMEKLDLYQKFTELYANMSDSDRRKFLELLLKRLTEAGFTKE